MVPALRLLCMYCCRVVRRHAEPESKPLTDETMDEMVAQCDGGLVRKEEAARVINKARSFLTTHLQLEAVFEQVAKEAGVSEPAKALVMPMMKHLTEQYTQIPELNDDDVEEVWEICDTNGDGRVVRPELLLALASWRDNMVRIYVKEEGAAALAEESDAPKAGGSSMCVLLCAGVDRRGARHLLAVRHRRRRDLPRHAHQRHRVRQGGPPR